MTELGRTADGAGPGAAQPRRERRTSSSACFATSRRSPTRRARRSTRSARRRRSAATAVKPAGRDGRRARQVQPRRARARQEPRDHPRAPRRPRSSRPRRTRAARAARATPASRRCCSTSSTRRCRRTSTTARCTSSRSQPFEGECAAVRRHRGRQGARRAAARPRWARTSSACNFPDADRAAGLRRQGPRRPRAPTRLRRARCRSPRRSAPARASEPRNDRAGAEPERAPSRRRGAHDSGAGGTRRAVRLPDSPTSVPGVPRPDELPRASRPTPAPSRRTTSAGAGVPPRLPARLMRRGPRIHRRQPRPRRGGHHARGRRRGVPRLQREQRPAVRARRRRCYAELPNGAELVKGDEVREGGFRIGVVEDIEAGQRRRTARSAASCSSSSTSRRAVPGRLDGHRPPALAARPEERRVRARRRARSSSTTATRMPTSARPRSAPSSTSSTTLFDEPTREGARQNLARLRRRVRRPRRRPQHDDPRAAAASSAHLSR